jgi:hypothetical protein
MSGTCEHCGGKVNEHGLAPLEEEQLESLDLAEQSDEQPPPDDAVERLFTKALAERGTG